MTYQLTVLYNQPEDPSAFDAYYSQTHAPLVEEVPGLQSLTTCKPDPGPRGEPAAAYLVAELRFEDRSAFRAAMSTDQGRATGSDLANFATGGVTMLSGEVTTYV
jgi:uncharacterized protein (TIGR02118 family)